METPNFEMDSYLRLKRILTEVGTREVNRRDASALIEAYIISISLTRDVNKALKSMRESAKFYTTVRQDGYVRLDLVDSFLKLKASVVLMEAFERRAYAEAGMHEVWPIVIMCAGIMPAINGKIERRTGYNKSGIATFGKYNGTPWETIAQTDPKYAAWAMCVCCFDDQVRIMNELCAMYLPESERPAKPEKQSEPENLLSEEQIRSLILSDAEPSTSDKSPYSTTEELIDNFLSEDPTGRFKGKFLTYKNLAKAIGRDAAEVQKLLTTPQWNEINKYNDRVKRKSAVSYRRNNEVHSERAYDPHVGIRPNLSNDDVKPVCKVKGECVELPKDVNYTNLLKEL
jgi:hypothetical protein